VLAFISFVFALVAVALAARSAGPIRVVAGVMAGLALVMGAVLTPGGLALDKVIARLVLPAGLVWGALIAAAFAAFVRRNDRLAAGAATLAVLHWGAGAPVVGQWLVNQVERPYAAIDPMSLPPLDAAVVLGGGTRDVDGRPRLDLAGDRVLLGAQLHRAGKVRRLITTGSSIPELGELRDLTKETTELWLSLGVPEADIIRLSRPKNTKQEIAAVKALVDTSTTIETVGLVTSAWHLKRALALADRAGLDAVPMPADVWSEPDVGRDLQDFIPDGTGFYEVHRAGWELLGRAVGR
jgi:uncharacterized SAM-binding protein YcdF (DUF218 family)